MRLFHVLEDFIRMIDSIGSKSHTYAYYQTGKRQAVNISQPHELVAGSSQAPTC